MIKAGERQQGLKLDSNSFLVLPSCVDPGNNFSLLGIISLEDQNPPSLPAGDSEEV